MEILQLKYFCDAAESQNFSQTARRFLVPPSCISQSIGRLERELGCELFHHRGNKVVLNESGRSFFAKAAAALQLLEEGASMLRDGEDAAGGTLNIVCTCSRSTVASAIERFTVDYPRVNLILRHEMPASCDFDILISEECPFAYKRRELILDEPICLAVNSGHPLASRGEIQVEELRRERFISMPDGHSLHDITVRICAAAGFVPNIAIRLDDPYYIRKYVELGLGVAMIPRVSWDGLFTERVALISVPGASRRVYAHLPSEGRIKQTAEKFLEILRSVHKA